MATTTTNMINSLLNEFYHPTTPTDRKRQIENELIAYKNHPHSWQESLLILQQQNSFINDQFVWFFNSSIIEYTITKRWNIIKYCDRSTIRDLLWRTYASLPINDTPKRQRDTIAQLLVLMGKRDFPDEYPNYISNIIELLEHHPILGFVLLRITSEEVVNSRDSLSSDKRKYFHSSFSLCLPKILNQIEKTLHMSICELNQQSINPSLPRNDNQNSKLLIELLSSVQHLFSWISLDVISENFLVNILELAKWRENFNDISIGAILILNELFYVQRSIPLPDTIIKGIKELLQQNNLGKSSEQYRDKFTELLRLYTNKYWSKILAANEIFHELIFALYRYTFTGNNKGCGALAFTEKLEIWTPLINGLTANNFNNGKYLDVMQSLVGGILKNMQFRFDQEQCLEILDNETLDENMETEWQHYLTQCIETIALITEGSQITVFEQVFNEWQRAFEMFLTLEKYINNNNGKTILIIEQTKCHFVHCILRDLSSLCQTLIRLTAVIETCYENCLDKLLQIKQFLLYLMKFLGENQIHCVNNENNEYTVLKTDISELYSQVLLALRSLSGCTLIINSDTELKELIEEVGRILLPITQQESGTVKLAAAQFLLRIATVIRPRFMLECNSILQLMQSGSKLSQLHKNVIIIIYQTIFSCLVLPWRNVDMQNQSYDNRTVILQGYITCIANDFLQIDTINNVNEQQIKTTIMSTLNILKDVCEYFIDTNTSTKQMLTNSLRSIVIKSLCICQQYGLIYNEIAETIYDFLLSIIRCFQVQLGATFVQEMVTVFLQYLSREQMNNNRLKVLEKILRMLILLIEQPGSSNLIPSILDLTTTQLLPWLQDEKNQSNNSDSVCLLYSLFDRILQHRWQYFYKSQILRGFSPGASDYPSPNDEEPQHKDQLLIILTAYGRVLVNGNDPHLCRIVLISLQELNDKWKLYSRDFFKNNLLNSFQHAIINVLFSNEGIIYQDLLLNVLFAMGQVNPTKLHDTFVSLGYSKNLEIINDICLATDLPTFSQKVTQLIQDTQKSLNE